jgi:hypothetical protein
MILAEQKPSSARVIAAVIFLVRFWIEPKNEHGSAEISIDIKDDPRCPKENATRTSCG